MRHPKWYIGERSALARRVHEMELDPSEAGDQLSGHVIDKDDEFMRNVVALWVTADLDREVRRLASVAIRRRRKELEAASPTGYQPTLDETLFPGPDSTLLAEDEEYAYDLLGRAKRHKERAEQRVLVVKRWVSAVGGNRDRKATRAQAKAALGNETGEIAADG
jgi:hypothetical protein